MNTFNFKIEDFQILHLNEKSVTLKDKRNGQIVFASKRVFNTLIDGNDHLCMYIEKILPNNNDGAFCVWLATMMTF